MAEYASAIVALGIFGAKVLESFLKFQSKWTDAPFDIRQLGNDLHAVHNTVQDLKTTCQHPILDEKPVPGAVKEDLMSSISNCSELLHLINKLTIDYGDIATNRWVKMRWNLLGHSKAMRLGGLLSQQKQTLVMQMSVMAQ